MNKNCCVYTSLIGGYEKLNEQPVAVESKLDFICFTDNEHLTSETWEIIHVDPVLPFDNIRSSRFIKYSPHKYLKKYSFSLYIDNSVHLKLPPERFIENFSCEESKLVLIEHSFRNTLLNEYEEVLNLQFDKPSTILEQLNAYSILNASIFLEKPYWLGIIFRDHNDENIIEAMEDLVAQVFRYSRRDQLAMNYILGKHKIFPALIKMDNHSSKYHEWPKSIRYGKPTFSSSLLIYSSESAARSMALEKKVKDLSEELINCYTENDKLEQLQIYYSQSRSWKITRPIRRVMNFIRKII